MTKLSKRTRTEVIISAILYILLGGALIGWPDAGAATLGSIVGSALAAMGVLRILGYFMDSAKPFRAGLANGILAACLGAWILLRPDMVAAILPVLFGAAILISAAFNLQKALDLQRLGFEKWWIELLIGLVGGILAAVVSINPFTAPASLMVFTGAGLIFSGAADIVILIRTSSFIKEVTEALENEDK